MPETTDTVGKMLADLAETPAAITRLANRAYAHRLFPEYAEATYPSLPRSAGPSASSQPPTPRAEGPADIIPIKENT